MEKEYQVFFASYPLGLLERCFFLTQESSIFIPEEFDSAKVFYINERNDRKTVKSFLPTDLKNSCSRYVGL
jgi:hypothetical protein